MRLAVVNHHGRMPAGAERALLAYLECLPSTIQPILFLFEEGEFAEILRKRFPETFIIPLSTKLVGRTRESLRFGDILESIYFSWKLARAFHEQRVDAVLTNSMKAHLIGSCAARLARLPCINYIHDILHGRARVLLRFISRLCAQQRLACSQRVADSLALPTTEVLHPPLHIADFVNLPTREEARAQLGIPLDGRPIVSLIGRIARWKGQDRFIRVAAHVLKEYDAHFMIVGSPIFGCDASYPQELESLTEQLNIQDRVHFIPWQSNLRNTYAATDIGCNCSTEEPFAITTLEVLATGRPAICFDDSGLGELLLSSDAGALVPAGDEVAYAKTLLFLLNNEEECQRRGANAKRLVQKLDIAALSPKFTQAMHSLTLSPKLTVA